MPKRLGRLVLVGGCCTVAVPGCSVVAQRPEACAYVFCEQLWLFPAFGIAEEPVPAGAGAIQRPASVPPAAVRATEAGVIRLRHGSSITATSARCPLRGSGFW